MMIWSCGDLVLTPDDRVATVVYLAPDGRIAVETPWSAQWERFDPGDLRALLAWQPDSGDTA